MLSYNETDKKSANFLNERNIDTDYNEKNIEQKEKLPLKSINGRRCLTKCYPKGAVFLHPVLLTGVVAQTNNNCAIEPVHSKDPHYYREHDMILADKCNLEDNKIYQQPDELESILLSFYFNASDFLASIYGLHSFDQVIYWTLENDYLPFDTIRRVHNCAWKVFGNKMEELSNGVLEYYFDIARNHWLKDYVKIIQNKYSFDFTTKKKNISDISDNFGEIYHIIYSTYFTYNFFVNAIKRYVYEFQDKWEYIDKHYLPIKKFIFQQLLEYIDNENSKK